MRACVFPRPTSYYCVFAFDGPTFVQKRGGNYWQPDDEIRYRICQDRGAVRINCESEAVASTIQTLLDSGGFVRGVDYAVAYPASHDVVHCPGVSIEIGFGEVRVRGSSAWRPEPMPEEMTKRFREEVEKDETARFKMYCRTAAAVGIDAAAIAHAAAAQTHRERVARILANLKDSSGTGTREPPNDCA
jgi:hypothetical protein